MKLKSTLFIIFLMSVAIFQIACNNSCENHNSTGVDSTVVANHKIQIGAMLDSFHVAAGRADFENYFKYYTSDAIFIGTDATENWNKEKFMVWSKPYFDKGKAWNFKSVERHIYFGKSDDIAWFDELLNTQMKICRGSGVVVKQNNEWKVQQYVLSMTIPNSDSKKVIEIKTPIEDSLLNLLK